MIAELVKKAKPKAFEPIEIRLVLESAEELAEMLLRMSRGRNLIMKSSHPVANTMENFCIGLMKERNHHTPCLPLWQILSEKISKLRNEAENEES